MAAGCWLLLTFARAAASASRRSRSTMRTSRTGHCAVLTAGAPATAGCCAGPGRLTAGRAGNLTGVAATTAGALPPPASGVRTWGTLTDGPPAAEAGDKRGGGRPAGGGCSSGWLTAP